MKKKKTEIKLRSPKAEVIPTRLIGGTPHLLPTLSRLKYLVEIRQRSGRKTSSWIRYWRICASALWCMAEDSISETPFRLKLTCKIPKNHILKWGNFREFSSWLHRAVLQNVESKNGEAMDVFLYEERMREFVEFQVGILSKIWGSILKISVEVKNVGPRKDPVRICVFLRPRHEDSIPPDPPLPPLTPSLPPVLFNV